MGNQCEGVCTEDKTVIMTEMSAKKYIHENKIGQ